MIQSMNSGQTESGFLIDVYSLFAIAPWWATSRMQVFKHFHVLFVRPDCGTV